MANGFEQDTALRDTDVLLESDPVFDGGGTLGGSIPPGPSSPTGGVTGVSQPTQEVIPFFQPVIERDLIPSVAEPVDTTKPSCPTCPPKPARRPGTPTVAPGAPQPAAGTVSRIPGTSIAVPWWVVVLALLAASSLIERRGV